MLLSQCPSCQYQFWFPKVEPRRSAWLIVRINAYFCPSCGAQLRLRPWVVWVRSAAIAIAFLCLMMARARPELAGTLRTVAVLFPVLVILFPKKYDLLEPQP